MVPYFIESYEEDNGVTNFDVNFLFPRKLIDLSKSFLDEIKVKTTINAIVKKAKTKAPNSKYHIPNIEIAIIPITVYNCSKRTTGTVFVRGILNFDFNNCDFRSSPTFPGIIVREKPEV